MNIQKSVITPCIIVQILFFIAFIPFLPLLISWHWDWWEAWIYAIMSILGFVISRILAARRNPDLIAERARFMQHEDAQRWDKTLAPFLGIVILAGYVLSSYALIENRFFSAMVRLQTDRNHKVVSSGPYRWMRHPGYAGVLLTYLATPVFLDSSWAFLPTVFAIILYVIRTALEDRFLQVELAGYCDYARRVRYRLLPGVW
jgi:steroid 5-alpha reductase family enzyme